MLSFIFSVFNLFKIIIFFLLNSIFIFFITLAYIFGNTKQKTHMHKIGTLKTQFLFIFLYRQFCVIGSYFHKKLEISLVVNIKNKIYF